ncbi:MAG: KpsF/GutQ family sugar-phosphate isomerase [Betaproteobacteria bacterium]
MARTPNKPGLDGAEILAVARAVLVAEAEAVNALVDRLGEDFIAAVRMILAAEGRVVVCGVGKSGHIARKIASTLASTGSPAFFVHPTEASHGDLGMILPDDVVVALSNSGESDELLMIVPLLKRHGAKLIAVTGNVQSRLARQADVHLDANVEREADPLGLAPTSSTTAALALGDALALALLNARGFCADDFARSHPGGSLGRRLLVRVSEVMHVDNTLPKVDFGTLLPDALTAISSGGLGMAIIVDVHGRLLGVFTDGDLRRIIEKGVDIRHVRVGDVMVAEPHTIGPDQLAAEAVKYMDRYRINGLLVVDDRRRLLGAFNMHDLFRAGVV